MNIEDLGLAVPPPLQEAPLHCTVTKSYKYISLVFHRGGQEPLAVFTVHQADAARMREALELALAAPSDSFEVRVIGRTTEGILRGGPPKREDLVEFGEDSSGC